MKNYSRLFAKKKICSWFFHLIVGILFQLTTWIAISLRLLIATEGLIVDVLGTMTVVL
jgi:hypothetical protein